MHPNELDPKPAAKPQLRSFLRIPGLHYEFDLAGAIETASTLLSQGAAEVTIQRAIIDDNAPDEAEVVEETQ